MAEIMSLEAIEKDPWAAVQLPLPSDANRDLLETARSAAEECEREAWSIIRAHDPDDPDSVGYAAEMQIMAREARDRADQCTVALELTRRAEHDPQDATAQVRFTRRELEIIEATLAQPSAVDQINVRDDIHPVVEVAYLRTKISGTINLLVAESREAEQPETIEPVQRKRTLRL